MYTVDFTLVELKEILVRQRMNYMDPNWGDLLQVAMEEELIQRVQAANRMVGMILELKDSPGGLILAVLLLDYFLKPKLDFPMPYFRLPLLGHMLFIRKKPQQTFDAWGAKCDPVYMIQVLNKTIIVVNDNMVFQKMCDNGNFEARNKSVRLNILACAEKDGIPKDIFSQDATPKQQHLKKFTLALVDKMRNSSFFYDLVAHAQDNIKQEIRMASVNDVADPYEAFTRGINNYYLCATNGVLIPTNGPTCEKLVRATKLIRFCMSSEGSILETFPFLKYVGNRAYNDLQQVNSLMMEVFQDLKMEVDNNGSNLGLASGYLTDQDKRNEPEDVLTSWLMKDCMFSETVATSIYGIAMILASHPEVQDKIRGQITSKDCQLPYIEAFLMESLRYIGPVPMIVRQALQDTTIGGCRVPKETNVIVNVYAGHHDRAKWGDPWVVCPERFLGSDGNLLPESDPIRQNFKVFGDSKKMCMGMPVVKDVLFSLIASLVDSFDISGVAGIEVPYDSRSWDVIAVAALPKGCQMRFTPRK